MWIAGQWWLSMRWRWLHARRETERAVAIFGPDVAQREGLSIEVQKERILALSRRYCIRPWEAYWYRLYRDPGRALDFVYAAETVGLHVCCNGPAGAEDESVLADKLLFAERAAGLGLPVTPTLAIIDRGTAPDLSALEALAASAERGVFVKARSGSRGLGAFFVQNGQPATRLAGRTLEGTDLEGPEAVSAALAGICGADDALVQPRLAAHPVLSRAATADDAVVLRVITRNGRADGNPSRVACAFLRVPMVMHRGPDARSVARAEAVLRVDPSSGGITRPPDSVSALLPETEVLEAFAIARLGDGTTVPFWPEVRSYSLTAQDAVPRLWSVGWDWIVTSEGPRLLEGNVYWDMRRPQEVEGGLLHLVFG